MPKNISALLVPVLLCSFLAFSSWAAYQAVTHVSEIIDLDYYSKGLKYNNTLLEKRAADALGWQLNSTLDAGNLLQYLKDNNGEPVSGASGRLSLQYQDNVLILPLQETAPGVYRARLPELTGEHLIRSDFERDGARISRRLLLTI